jgi:hypothetical protein
VKPLSAGSEIDAWCTKCRLDLGHRIVAMVRGRPKRVVCQTCGSEHNYRPPHTLDRPGVINRTRADRPSAAPKQSAPSARARAEADRLREWESRIAGNVATAFARYAISRRFALGELLLHSKFGEGYVAELLEDNKINVMFRDGPKVLVHGQT